MYLCIACMGYSQINGALTKLLLCNDSHMLSMGIDAISCDSQNQGFLHYKLRKCTHVKCLCAFQPVPCLFSLFLVLVHLEGKQILKCDGVSVS